MNELCSPLDRIPGVSEISNEKIVRALKHLPMLDRAILFGSRATGRYKSGSDIDICLLGEELEMTDVTFLKSNLDDQNVPYELDFCLWKKIESGPLKEHILTHGIDLKLT